LCTSVAYPANGAPPLDDGQIVEIAEAIDFQQTQTGRLATIRASDPDVHTFAEDLLASHRQEKQAWHGEDADDAQLGAATTGERDRVLTSRPRGRRIVRGEEEAPWPPPPSAYDEHRASSWAPGTSRATW